MHLGEAFDLTLKDGKTGMTLKIVKIHESDLKQRMIDDGG